MVKSEAFHNDLKFNNGRAPKAENEPGLKPLMRLLLNNLCYPKIVERIIS